MTTRPAIRLDLTVLDAPDIAGLAAFYCAVLGWEQTETRDDWITIRPAAGAQFGLAFQLAPDFVAPTWPDEGVPQQSHLDLDVPDLDEAEAFVLATGATATGLPGGSATWRVYLDPAGHPFCLCLEGA